MKYIFSQCPLVDCSMHMEVAICIFDAYWGELLGGNFFLKLLYALLFLCIRGKRGVDCYMHFLTCAYWGRGICIINTYWEGWIFSARESLLLHSTTGKCFSWVETVKRLLIEFYLICSENEECPIFLFGARTVKRPLHKFKLA